MSVNNYVSSQSYEMQNRAPHVAADSGKSSNEGSYCVAGEISTVKAEVQATAAKVKPVWSQTMRDKMNCGDA